MHHGASRFAGADGLELSFQYWRPAAEPRAVVVLVHGVCEHSGRYGNVVRRLVEDGYVVYGYDQRGHGASPGPRVHIRRWAEYREDLGAFLRLVTEQMPGLPVVLYGHSMGALIVLDHLLVRPSGLAGAVISGAPVEPAGVGKPYQIAAARLLSGVLPRFSVDINLDPCSLSRDPEVQEDYRSDPMVTSRVTLRWGAESLDAVRRVKEGMAGIATPMLVLHGEADPLNLAEGARRLSAAVPLGGTTLRIYPGVFHEPHNDTGHEQVVADVREWLARVTDARDVRHGA